MVESTGGTAGSDKVQMYATGIKFHYNSVIHVCRLTWAPREFKSKR